MFSGMLSGDSGTPFTESPADARGKDMNPLELSRTRATLSLKWLLAQPELELLEIFDTGKRFSVIHPCELEDPTEFINAGAVILLTGIAFKDAPGKFHDYVARLASKDVTAIGFGVGLAFPETPQELVTAAQEQGISLFEVPRPIPFVSILAAVHKELGRLANAERESLLEAQAELNQAASVGLEHLLQVTSRNLEAHVALLDNDLRYVATANFDGLPTMNRNELADLVVQHGFGVAGRIEALNVFGYSMAQTGERKHGLVAMTRGKPTATERSILRHAAGLAELIVARPNELRSIHQNLNSLAIAIQLGLSKTHETMASVFASASDANGFIRPVLLKAETAVHHDRAMAALDVELERNGRFLFSFALDPTTSLIVVRGSRSYKNILRTMLNARGSTRVAVGPAIPWQELSMESVAELERTVFGLRLGESAGPEAQSLNWAKDPGVRSALVSRKKETWGKLEQYDADNGTEFVKTLEVYLRHTGHISRTAEILEAHRHTIRKRMAAISKIIEADLENPAVTAELFVIALATGDA